MSASKDTKRGTWKVYIRYIDWMGNKQIKTKRGFQTKKEALAWEREFLQSQSKDMNMSFKAFAEIYMNDMKPRIRESTMENKRYIIDNKLIPYFGSRSLASIKASDIIQWQNELLNARDEDGNAYSPTYLRTIQNQLSAIFNHARRFYSLPVNPSAQAGKIGRQNAKEMHFWTQDEFLQFIEYMKVKPVSYYAFEILYWTGIREGDADGKISLNQQKPSKHAGLRRFGPEKFLQRNNEFMKERPIFYKKPIKTEKDFSTWLRCFYYTTKAVITEYIYF